MIKIQTSGDYVQLIYVDPVQESVQQELKSDTDAFECSYDSDGKLFMQFGSMRFENPDPTDFEIDGVAITDSADFISKLNALFTGGGGGGWGTSGTVATLTGSASLDANGNEFGIHNARFFVNTETDQTALTLQDGTSQLNSFNPTGEGNTAFAQAVSSTDQAGIELRADFNDGVKRASILGYANTDEAEIEYTADEHTFTGIINLPTQAAPGAPEDGWIWREDNTNTGLKIRINGVTKTITVS